MPNYGHIITADYPDIVHIWGEWNEQTIKEIKHWKRIFTPVVFSSLQGLSELCTNSGSTISALKKKDVRTVCRLSDIVIVQGQKEHDLVEKYGKKDATILLNPTVTSIVSEQETASLLNQIYTSLYQSHDKRMQEQCQKRSQQATADESMSPILAQILYVRYLFQHGTCYDSNLTQLSESLKKLDTDEERLSNVFQRIKIKTFTQRIMAIMEQRGYLSEGFMPIEKLDDKQTKQMNKTIRQREKQ